MQELIISPSILSLDYSKVSEQLDALNHSGAKWMHFDVMDGHFVPNLTFGPDILKGFKKASPLVMDVHIMVDDPQMFAEVFMKAGADIVTFHLEAVENIDACVKLCRKIRSMGGKAGVSLKPNTPVDALLPVLEELDLVLIMSVEPGFGGQSFMAHTLEKVKILRQEISQRNLPVHLEIDGGINRDTARQAILAGCDVLVAGSYVFKQDIRTGVQSLLCAAQS
ncbi:MAG: ribulose-phosphate 3-epimerase [Erysipelotrichaceae bacterium]|nr:ribulose-phosphate 3-epimerase [Erysipelotrichaceae bacterium]